MIPIKSIFHGVHGTPLFRLDYTFEDLPLAFTARIVYDPIHVSRGQIAVSQVQFRDSVVGTRAVGAVL